MSSGALKRNPYFNGQASQQQVFGQYGQATTGTLGNYGQQPGQPQGGYGQQSSSPYAMPQQAPQYGTPSADAMNHQFDMPAATSDQMDRMSYNDVIAKTAGLFVAVLVFAAIAWGVTAFINPGLGMILAVAGSIGALVTGLVMAFSKTPKPAVAWIFAVCEGLLVGGFSAFLELVYPGIVMQATLATFAVVATTLVLFRFGKVRTSPRLTKIVMIALIGYGVFSLINFGYMLIGPMTGADVAPWGMRSVEIFGIPLGVIIGILAVLMGAYSLVMDFEFIENGVKSGAPRSFGWIAAYSLVSTVVFIYIEILRLIAIFRGSD